MKRLTRRLNRRGWMYVSGGLLGALLITAAAAWACMPIPGAETVIVSPNSTTFTFNVGVNIRSYTRVTSGLGLPRTDNSGALLNYQFRLRGLNTTSGAGVCEHQPAYDVGAFAENGAIGSATNPVTRLVRWTDPLSDHSDNYDLDPTEPHSTVCWSPDVMSQGDQSSSRENFYLL